jgi:hypothetical protein
MPDLLPSYQHGGWKGIKIHHLHTAVLNLQLFKKEYLGDDRYPL